MTDPSQAHLLSLKVMRLSRPSFVLSNPTFYEPTNQNTTSALDLLTSNDFTIPSPSPLSSSSLPSFPAKDFSESSYPPSLTSSDIAKVPRIRDLGISDLLTLPSSFGNIYLGETFSSYLCINNESGVPVQDVGMKAELQTTSQKFVLTDTLGGSTTTSSSTPRGSASTSPKFGNINTFSTRVSLLPGQSTESIIQHEIKELGIHILVCSVHYSVQSERRFFRKFYKFQVLNPLAVKTKVNSLPDGRILLEAQLQV